MKTAPKTSRDLHAVLMLGLVLVCVACGRQADREAVPDYGYYDGPVATMSAPPGTSIIIITFDALRADHLGAYGNDMGMTPNLDMFARQATIFLNAYTAGGTTAVSFAAALTGRLPPKALDEWHLVAKPTLGELFQLAGYRTAAFFNNAQLRPARGYNRGFDHFRVVTYSKNEGLIEEAAAWLGKDDQRPVMLWLHLIAPHSPYVHRQGAEHLYDPEYVGQFSAGTGVIFSPVNPAEREQVRRLYRGEVFYADQLFGQIMKDFTSAYAIDDAIVVVSSDHGEAFDEHGKYQHATLHEEVARIPLMMRMPQQQVATRTRYPYLNIDLLPTLANLAGLTVPSDLDGINLAAHELTERTPISFYMLSEHLYAAALWKDGMKLIQYCNASDEDEQLYDLVVDPLETINRVLDYPAHTRNLSKLLAELTGADPCDAIEDSANGVDPLDRKNLDQVTLEKLRSLGYIQ